MSPESVAKLTFIIALSLIVLSALVIYFVIVRYNVVISWSGVVTIREGNYKISYGMAFFDQRPMISYEGKQHLTPLFSIGFSDLNSVYAGKRIGKVWIPRVTVNNTNLTIIARYGPFSKFVYVKNDAVIIVWTNAEKLKRITFEMPLANKFEKIKNGITLLSKDLFGFPVNVTVQVRGCEITRYHASIITSPISKKSGNGFSFDLNCSNKATFMVKIEDKGAKFLPIPLVALFPLYVSAVGLVVWYLYLSKRLNFVKSIALALLFLSLAGGVSGHHWDLLMFYWFSKLAYHMKDLYAWTYENSMLIREYSPNPLAFFPGYAYFPHLIPLFLPFGPIDDLIGKFYIPLNPLSLKLGFVQQLFFKPLTFIYYMLVKCYLMFFLFINFYIVYKYYDKEKAWTFALGLLTLSITLEWGMYEVMLLPFLLLSLIYIKREGRLSQFLSGLFWSTGSAKIYPILSAPALIFVSKDWKWWLLGFLIAQIPTLYFLIKEPIPFLYSTLLFHTRRNVGDVNFYPSFLLEPLNALWLGSIGSFVEFSLILLTYYFIFKYKPSPERAALLPLIPFVMFNRLVSPQHYLTLGTLVLLAGFESVFFVYGILIFLHINFVMPTAAYMVYHWASYSYTRNEFLLNPNSPLIILMMAVLPSVLYPWIYLTLAATNVKVYAESLKVNRSRSEGSVKA